MAISKYTGPARGAITFLLDQKGDALWDVVPHKEKRSLSQNAYYWVLVNKLAAAAGLSDTEVHRQMLRDYGVAEVYSVREDVPFQRYFKYCEEVGTGQVNGSRFKHVKVYLGSSQMDSKEFTRLIDGIRHECETVGIQVMTPEEIARLRFIEPERTEDD